MRQNKEIQDPMIRVQGLLDAVKLSLTLKPETFAMPEVAAILGVHPQTAREWVDRGVFPPPIIKVGRTVRWSRAQLDKFITDGVHV